MRKYCEDIKKSNLNDIEVIIKLVSDLWENIDGYDVNSGIIEGFDRIYLYEHGIGCCRHFADDMVEKLNYINSKYNARLLYVYMEKIPNEIKSLPIKQKIISNSRNKNNDSNDTLEDKNEKQYANHVVCAVDLPNKNITLMVDPTNLIIGYIKGKNIKFCGTKKTNYKYTMKTNFIFNGRKTFKLLKDNVLRGFRVFYSNKKIEELCNYDEQMKALEHIKYIDSENKKNNNCECKIKR